MRQKLTRQMSIFSVTMRHDIGKDLAVFSEILDGFELVKTYSQIALRRELFITVIEYSCIQAEWLLASVEQRKEIYAVTPLLYVIS